MTCPAQVALLMKYHTPSPPKMFTLLKIYLFQLSMKERISQWNILLTGFSQWEKCLVRPKTSLSTMLSGWKTRKMMDSRAKEPIEEEWQWKMYIKCKYWVMVTFLRIKILKHFQIKISSSIRKKYVILDTKIKIRIKMTINIFSQKDYSASQKIIFLSKGLKKEKSIKCLPKC